MNTEHLSALRVRLSHEEGYLARAKTSGERELRRVWIAQITREIEQEKTFLGVTESDELPAMSDDELLAELAG